MGLHGWHLLILLAIALILGGGLHLPAKDRHVVVRVTARRRSSR